MENEAIIQSEGLEFDVLVEKLLDIITDPMVRSIVFKVPFNKNIDADYLLSDMRAETVIEIMRRLINLIYLISYCRWKDLDDTKETKKWGDPDDIAYFDNARFSRLFKSAIVNEEITLDLQIFSLIELWIGLKKAPGVVSHQFYNIFDDTIKGNDIGLTLQTIRDIIKNADYKVLDTNAKYTQNIINEWLYKLANSFVIIMSIELFVNEEAGDDEFKITYELNRKEMVTLYPNRYCKPAKFIISNKEMDQRFPVSIPSRPNILQLFIINEMTLFNEEVQAVYKSFDDVSTYRINFGKQEAINHHYDEKHIREMRKFLSFNYKKIRDFALIISDALAIHPNKKEEIFARCESDVTLRSIVKDAMTSSAENIYWDNIIVLMLVETGQSEFLETILDDESLFNEILKMSEWRIGKEESRKAAQEYEREKNALLASGVKEGDKKIVSLRTTTVLNAIGMYDIENERSNPFAESLSYKYSKILNYVNNLKEAFQTGDISFNVLKTNMKNLSNVFKDIFVFLQVFYTGLDAYALAKEGIKPNPLEGLHRLSEKEEMDLEQQKRKDRMKCWGDFKAAAAKKLEAVGEQSAKEAFDAFVVMCHEYSSFSDDLGAKDQNKAKRLKRLLTRGYICDPQKLKYFADITFKQGSEEVKTTIFDMTPLFNLFDGDDPVAKKQIIDCLGQFQDLFLFLIYNEDYNKKGLYNTNMELEDKDCDPVYPYLVTYYKQNIDRDKMKKCTYRVPIPSNGSKSDPNDKGKKVNLLTDDDYLADTYFCIPLRYGCSNNWWINPFLIPVRTIKDIYSSYISGKD